MNGLIVWLRKIKMIKVEYFGRTGNQIFQWVFARLLAEKNGLGIGTEPPAFFHTVLPAMPGNMNTESPEQILEDTVNYNHEQPFFDRDYTKANIHLHGYFQNADYYRDRNRIKSYFNLPRINKNTTDDIVIHLRLTDYWWHRVASVIHPGWYLDILRKEKYGTCYVVVEPHETNRKYLSILSNNLRKIKVISGTPANDFEFIRRFDRIICSNSTFAWWAAFLSDASKIWTFEPWMKKDRMNLAYMEGAIPVPGTFYTDIKLSSMDWDGYWLKEKKGKV